MLKIILLRKKLEKSKKELEELRKLDPDFEKREKELTEAIGEITDETSDEDKTEIEGEVEAFEGEKEEHETKKEDLAGTIRDIEAEIKEEEEKERQALKEPEKRESEAKEKMNKRTKFFKMTMQERDAFFAREDVKQFIERAKELIPQKRGVTGGELLIPVVMLDLVRENIMEYSKLIRRVNLQSVPGKARQTVMGTVPEAVWTEACGIINELTFVFNQVEVDGYKVGGVVPICNALLEDNDIGLLEAIITGLGQSIGLAVDKAILFGTGTKMPLGIATRLVQTSEPADYPSSARTWVDLHTSNVKTIAANKTDINLFKELMIDSGAAKGKYSRGTMFWTMNETTYTALKAAAMSINAAGAIVSGLEGTMPVIGGDVDVLSFIPDNMILGGYGDLYVLVERAGMAIATSEHAKFIEDMTVVKGTARYDGMPVIAEGFVFIGIGGTTPSVSGITFAQDTANAVEDDGGEG